MVLAGEAGIGKTALLEYLTAVASNLTVLRAAGVESEMELAYASLHQLCGPLLDRIATLPGPQRQALEIVFGRSAGAPPDRFLVGLAILSLLSAAADERALLCVIDDAQWLDEASVLTLAFVARRLLAEPVGIVFAARDPGEELMEFPELEVHGLQDGDARTLLSSAVPFILSEQARDRIVAETRGNPLALIELPRGLTATEVAAGFELLGGQGVTSRIEQSFVRRLNALPGDARRLLLLASAETVGDPLLLWRSADRLGIARAAASALETDGLLAIRQRVTFRHPLVRSTVYQSATVMERRVAHLALADAIDREADPDRRAWHLAAAATGNDEQVALELESSAGRAQARGGAAAAAAFLRRAVELTQDLARRADRALAAAQASLDAGAFEAVRELLTAAEAEPLDEFQRARVELLRGHVAFASGLASDAPRLLLKAASRLEPLNLGLARQTYLDAWVASMFAGPFAGDGLMQEISRAALSTLPPTGQRRASDVLLDGLAVSVTEGRAAAVPLLNQAARAFAEEEIGSEDGLRWGWMAQRAAFMLWDEERWHSMTVRQLESVREAGLMLHLPLYLNGLGGVLTWRGDFAAASALIAEADAIANATGRRIAPYAAVLLAALRGSEADAAPLIKASSGPRERQNKAWVSNGANLCVESSTTVWASMERHCVRPSTPQRKRPNSTFRCGRFLS